MFPEANENQKSVFSAINLYYGFQDCLHFKRRTLSMGSTLGDFLKLNDKTKEKKVQN